jgi:hypothetical protein
MNCSQYDLAVGEFLKGNPESAAGMWSHGQGVTLANPFGPAVRGWEQVAATIEHASSQMRDGEIVDEVQMPGSHLRFVRTLDFEVLDGLGARAARQVRIIRRRVVSR